MKNIFKFKPKIKKGHSFDEYISKYSNDYVNVKLDKVTDAKKLKPNKTYWKIGDKFYQVNHKHIFKIIGITIGFLGVATSVALPVTYHFINKEHYVECAFQYWNESESLNTLKSYVKDVVTPSSKNYIPKEDRIATFDMDGTLFGERAPIYIEWLMFHDYLNNVRPTFKEKEIEYNLEKKTLAEIDNMIVEFMNDHDKEIKSSDLENWEAHGGAFLFQQLSIPQYVTYVDSFLERKVDAFNNLKYKDMFYKPMTEVVNFLQVNNFDVYIVSGTDRFMVRDIVNKHLTIPSNKVIGMDVSLTRDSKGVVRRGDKLMYKNVEEVKVELITQEIGKKPVLSFGNSGGDVPMHDYCLSNENYKSAVFMVNNDDDAREYKQDRSSSWKEHPKYNVFSMKNHWKTIYGDNVTKKQ